MLFFVCVKFVEHTRYLIAKTCIIIFYTLIRKLLYFSHRKGRNKMCEGNANECQSYLCAVCHITVY